MIDLFKQLSVLFASVRPETFAESVTTVVVLLILIIIVIVVVAGILYILFH